jgi:hypothetical protein
MEMPQFLDTRRKMLGVLTAYGPPEPVEVGC